MKRGTGKFLAILFSAVLIACSIGPNTAVYAEEDPEPAVDEEIIEGGKFLRK